MSEVLLYNGDCIQAMGGIADHSINLILTDPPYNLGNFMISRDTNLKKMRDNFFGAAGWDNLEYDEWIKAIDGFFEQAARVMKKGGSKTGNQIFSSVRKTNARIALPHVARDGPPIRVRVCNCTRGRNCTANRYRRIS